MRTSSTCASLALREVAESVERPARAGGDADTPGPGGCRPRGGGDTRHGVHLVRLAARRGPRAQGCGCAVDSAPIGSSCSSRRLRRTPTASTRRAARPNDEHRSRARVGRRGRAPRSADSRARHTRVRALYRVGHIVWAGRYQASWKQLLGAPLPLRLVREANGSTSRRRDRRRRWAREPQGQGCASRRRRSRSRCCWASARAP